MRQNRGVQATSISRKRLSVEISIVLLLGIAQTAVYSLVSIVARLTADKPLGEQTAAINPSRSQREWLDATYQLLGNLFPLVLVALALYLLWLDGSNPFRRIGLDGQRPRFDVSRGLLLVLIIGVPGLGLYALGRALGITVAVEAANLSNYWWTIPVLVLAAARASLEEEVVGVGYLFTRLRQLGWHPWVIISSVALLRGTYHLYQGFGPFVGNVLMGVVFGWAFVRWGRVMPLVIAHFVIDVVAFVGYPVAVSAFRGIFA